MLYGPATQATTLRGPGFHHGVTAVTILHVRRVNMTPTIHNLTDRELIQWIRYFWCRLEAHRAMPGLHESHDEDWWLGLLAEHIQAAWERWG